MKFPRYIFSGCLILSLVGCSMDLNLPLPSPSVSVQPDEQPTVKPSLGDKKAFPLKFELQRECSMGNLSLYEVDASGEFGYAETLPDFESTEQPPLKKVQLTATEFETLLALLKQNDLRKLHQASEKVPPDSEQTEECRSVEVLSFSGGETPASFDLNGRQFVHSAEYQTAFEKIKTYLEQLKQNHTNQTGVYSLPLTLSEDFECEETQTRYQVSQDGLLRFGFDKGEPKAVKLSSEDLAKLQTALNDADLANLFKDSEAVPPDAPQTRECRTIQNLALQVNGQAQTFDLNGRKFNHTEAYRQALTNLIAVLEALEKSHSGQTTSADYALPLNVKVEGECDMGSWTRYAITADGNFSFAREDLPTFAPGNPPIESAKLSAAELEEIQMLLNQLNLWALFQDLTPVSPDAPQTTDCRSIESVSMGVNGEVQTLQGRGTRAYQLDEPYTKALDTLDNHLKALLEKYKDK